MEEKRNDQQEAFAQLFYANSEKLVQIQKLKERVRVLEEALSAVQGVKDFMVMPRDYWDDTWKEETENRYYAAEARMKAALQALEGGTPDD